MKYTKSSRQSAFTIAEICIALAVLASIGGLAYSMLMSSTTLLAKNLSLNASNTTVHTALDRMYADINQAITVRPPPPFDPESARFPSYLIDTTGTIVSTGPAAGIMVDRYVGGPYIVGNPGSGLAATATTFKLYYSTDPMANPPVPTKNDVVIMDGVTRALVSSASSPTTAFASPIPNPTPNPGKCVTITLKAKLGTYTNPTVESGTAIPWQPLTQQTAYVVHRVAYLVVPVRGVGGPTAELRMYPDAENLTDVISDPASYTVLSREIGTKTFGGLAEHLPFDVVKQNGANFLKIAMRVEDQQFNKRLSNQQQNEVNTFVRLDTILRPRNTP